MLKSHCVNCFVIGYSVSSLDESTLPGNKSLIFLIIRCIEKGVAVQELLFSKILLTDTKGVRVFETYRYVFHDKQSPRGTWILAPTAMETR